MEKITLYGIPNCDTTKKAMQWFTKHKLPFTFHDYKTSGIGRQQLESWCRQVGWEALFNKRSTTWRELTEKEQKQVNGQPAAVNLMLEKNTIIKRPVAEFNDKLLVGFKEEDYKQTFRKHINNK